MKLRDYLARYKGERGVERIMTLAEIRRYVSTKSLRVLIDEINSVNTVEDLNILVGAGMRGQLYIAVMGRKAQLTEF